MIPRYFLFGIILSILVTLADQAIKSWVVSLVFQPPGEPDITKAFHIDTITSFFNLVLGFNRGVSFGMFNTHSEFGSWILSSISLAITAVLLVWMWQADKKFVALALALIIGGALGNVIDRLSIGAVVDFLDFHYAGLHWPAFNIADMAITCGAASLIWDSLFGPQENRK